MALEHYQTAMGCLQQNFTYYRGKSDFYLRTQEKLSCIYKKRAQQCVFFCYKKIFNKILVKISRGNCKKYGICL